MFGAKQILPVSKDEKEKKNFQSLYESNKKQGLTTTLHRSQSTVFHAGVIGQGLRSSVFGPILPKVIDYLLLIPSGTYVHFPSIKLLKQSVIFNAGC